eukprot:scaffold34454_cov35-Tisochrysis_lutea.AAC.1
MSPTVTMRDPSDDQVICCLIEKRGRPVPESTPRLRNQLTALSFELAETRSTRPSPSKSAPTTQRAPIACCVTRTTSGSIVSSVRPLACEHTLEISAPATQPAQPRRVSREACMLQLYRTSNPYDSPFWSPPGGGS